MQRSSQQSLDDAEQRHGAGARALGADQPRSSPTAERSIKSKTRASSSSRRRVSGSTRSSRSTPRSAPGLSFAGARATARDARRATRNGSSRLRQRGSRARNRLDADPAAARAREADLDCTSTSCASSVQNDRGRLTSLEALQEAALGTSSEQVNRWLRRRRSTSSRRLAQELVVEAGWERAVETVLGPYLQAVISSNIDDVAARCPSSPRAGCRCSRPRRRRRARGRATRCSRACRRPDAVGARARRHPRRRVAEGSHRARGDARATASRS